MSLIVAYNSAPCSPIHPASPVCCAALGVERVDSCGRRKAVERHIDQRRMAPGGSGSRCSIKSFPLGASRVINVNVGINQTRKNCGLSEVVDLGTTGNVVEAVEADEAFDFFVAYQYRARFNTLRSCHPFGTKNLHTKTFICYQNNLARPEPIVPSQLFQPSKTANYYGDYLGVAQ